MSCIHQPASILVRGAASHSKPGRRRGAVLSLLSLVALAALAALAPAEAKADLVGTTVTGSLRFGVSPTNFWDPANASSGVNIPPGVLNTTSPTVVISATQVEFGFLSSSGFILTADFTGNQLTITETVAQTTLGLSAQHFTFTDNAFAGLFFAPVSSTFDNGGLSESLAGNQFTIDWPGSGPVSVPPGTTHTAVYNFIPSTVPEPSSVAMMGMGAVGIVAFGRRRLLKARR